AQLEKKKDVLKTQIEKALSGTFDRKGVSYTVSASITLNVVGSEEEAKKSGADNIAGMVDNTVMLGLPGGNKYGALEGDWDAGTFAHSGESFDRMVFAADAASFDHSTPPHEFAHGLGGEHSRNPQ